MDIDYGEKRAKLSLKAMKKRVRYKTKCPLVDEKVNVVNEFNPIKVRMDDFVKDAKERLCL